MLDERDDSGVSLEDVRRALDAFGATTHPGEAPTLTVRSVRWLVPGGEEVPRDVDGALVLAVGRTVADEDIEALVENLARAGARAVVISADQLPAERLATEVIVCPPETDWSAVHASIQFLIREQQSSSGADELEDVTEFANLLAAKCDGHVMIADRTRRIFAWSSIGDVDGVRRESLVARVTPESMSIEMRRDGSWQRLSSGLVTEYYGNEEDGRRLRLGIAVRVGSEVVGLLSILPAPGADLQKVREGLAWGAQAAVPHCIRHLALQAKGRSASAIPLLEGRDISTRVLSTLGLHRSTCYCVIAVTAREARTASSVRLVSTLDLHIAAMSIEAVTALAGDIAYVIVGGELAAARRLGESVERTFRQAGVPIVAGIGGEVATAKGIPSAREQADLVLRALLDDDAHAPVAHLADVRARVILHRLRDLTADAAWMLEGPVARLTEHDRYAGTDLLVTFEAWMNGGRSGRQAAKILGLHPSSVAARLDRIWQLTNLDPSDPEDLLAAEIELRVASGRR